MIDRLRPELASLASSSTERFIWIQEFAAQVTLLGSAEPLARLLDVGRAMYERYGELDPERVAQVIRRPPAAPSRGRSA